MANGQQLAALPVDVIDDVAEFGGSDFRKLFAALIEMFVNFDSRLLHHAMRFLRTAGEHEVGATGDAFLIVFGIEGESEECAVGVSFFRGASIHGERS